MRRFHPFLLIFAWFLLLMPVGLRAAEKKPRAVAAAELVAMLAGAQGSTDGDLARQLQSVELSERLSAAELEKLGAALPGEKSRDALTVLTDRARFCCIIEGYTAGDPSAGPSGKPEYRAYDERVAYHGEIAFNPEDGSILGVRVTAELPAHGLVEAAGMLVELAEVEIGGRSFVCPQHAVSVLTAHTPQAPGTQSRAMYRGPVKHYLNDVFFAGYRRFGAEVKILP